VDARHWIDQLPLALRTQARLLHRLVDAVERDERFLALEVYGSLARGNADPDSDVDVRLWVPDERWAETADDVVPLLRSLGDDLDVNEDHYPTGRHVVVHYRDGTQIDAVARLASEAKGRVSTRIALLDREGLLTELVDEPVHHVDERQRRAWAFRGWLLLGQVDKHLRRGALWEALDALEGARAALVRLHASGLGVPDPELGAASIFDIPGADVPDGYATTYALPDSEEIRTAARAVARLLQEAHEPPPIAEWARRRLC
jgi:predicted nucleotidyltransferase